ncbi:hypothetical protein [Archangium sp.]|uniref:hypothetical protein n=1 Tax=Archangium sp. TaxID=1872627 RepID=UPI00389AC2D7
MSTRLVDRRLAGARPHSGWMGWALILLFFQVGCATSMPMGGGLGSYGYRPLIPRGATGSPPTRGVPPTSLRASGAEEVVSAQGEPERTLGPEEGEVPREEEKRERARQVERERAAALVEAAQREGRDAEAARETEAERALARVVGQCSGVEEVGTALFFAFWVEGGALTPVGYQQEGGSGRVGRPVDAEELARVLRRVFTGYMGHRTGEVVLKLRREEARWAVDYDATRQGSRPAEARTFPVRTQGTPADTFLAFHEAASKWTSAVQVPAGGAARVELEVQLENGRLAGWRLREVQRTREGPGGGPQALSSEVASHLVQALLPFTEGLGTRTVHVVLRAEHRLGEARARGRVESVVVERAAQPPGPSWYLSMHEATLLRWREGVVEGSAWLAQRGVEELALMVVGSIIAHGLGFFATEGLEWVTRALGREPEIAARWLSTALNRLSAEERATFKQLWQKVALEGEQALSRSERKTLRGLFVRLEEAIQEPLNGTLKDTLRQEARKYYAELYPQLAKRLAQLKGELPIHRINFLWGRFRMARPNPTADEVRRAAEIIDRQFEPWYHHVDHPSGLLKTADEAREAALSELRGRFPGLE